MTGRRQLSTSSEQHTAREIRKPVSGTLRLGDKQKHADAPEAVEVDSLDVRLPCRSFQIQYKIAEAGQHSLSSEFLLRLLRVAGDLAEDVVSGFFGFDSAETAFAIGEAEKRGLVSRTSGRVHLTAAGLEAFAKGGGKPQLYDVHRKSGRFDFDTISFSPAKTRPLAEFKRELCELPIADETRLARASQEAREGFRRHFREFLTDRFDQEADKKGLYAIDEVTADRRRDEVVPMRISVTTEAPGKPRPSVPDWRSGYELDSRSEVQASIANLASSLEVEPSWTADEAFDILIEVAPEQASRFRRGGRFDREAYFRNAARLVGDIQANRRTVPIIGTAWTNRNVERLSSAARLLRRERVGGGPPIAFWLRPALAHWGSNAGLPELAPAIMSEMDPPDDEGPAVRYGCIGAGASAGSGGNARGRRAFTRFLSLHQAAVPQGLEIFLVPRRLAIVSVHGALSRDRGYPVALGVLTVDGLCIERVHGIVSGILSRNSSAQEWFGGDQTPYEMLMDALDFSAPKPTEAE